MIEPEDKQQAAERDGFFKTALIACSANFYAINHDISPEQIAPKSARMALLLWDEVLKYRRTYVK